jgi:hypothetical protein
MREVATDYGNPRADARPIIINFLTESWFSINSVAGHHWSIWGPNDSLSL